MIAKRRYDIKVTRSNPASIEVVDIEDGEVVLFWDCTPKDARRMEQALRHDLVVLEAQPFIDRWTDISANQLP